MRLQEVKNQIFVDYSTCKCKIKDINGKIRTIRFKVYFDDYNKYVFEVEKKYEKYCVI